MKKWRIGNGIENLEKREMLDASDVIISEFLAVNGSSSIKDEDGDSSDWLELHNDSADVVNLGGMILQDSTSRWTLPEVVLDPFESIIVFASGKDRTTNELHANFKLSSEGERLSLLGADGETVVHEYNPYPPQFEDVSYGVEMTTGETRTLLQSVVDAKYVVPTDEQLGLTWTTTAFDDSSWSEGQTGIGYERSGSNYAPFLNTRVPTGTIGFYTRMAFNADVGAISQLVLQMRYDDGFIAYLNGQRVADGNGPTNPLFNSPATGENSDGDAVIFEPFDISLFKDLLQPSGNVLAVHSLNRNDSSSDLLMMAEVEYAAAGQSNVDEVGFFSSSTPGSANQTPVAGFTAPITIDLPHGFYESPQTVTISSEDTSATIRYTTDGSQPTANHGLVYNGGFTIDSTTVLRAAAFKDDLAPAPTVTSSYFFLDDVAEQDRQSTLDAGFPQSWNGNTADYGLDPDVIGENDDFDGKYRESLKDNLLAIPTLSIVMDIDDMFGSDGIYSNPSNSSLEKAASLELIQPDGTTGFQIDAGIKIQGGAFRSFGLTDKKSFRFKFQEEYGPKKLEYPLFGDDAVDSFDTITLRMEANDGWQWSSGDNTNRLYARDQWNRETQLAMGQPASHGTFGHVYINGFYWGTYNIVERPDEAFASDYIGGDKDDWDSQNSGRAINGDLASWETLVDLAREIDRLPDGSEEQLALWMQMQGLNVDGTNNPDFEDYLDVENYIDYLIINMFGGNSDWPHKNYYAGRQRGPDSTGYKFFMWDAEWSLNLRSDVSTNRTSISDGIAEPYSELRRVPEFQLWFADRVQKHFSPGGALYVDPEDSEWDPDHPERNVPAARFAAITDIVRSPLVAESARWGDQHGRPQTVDESWEPQVQFMLDEYFPERSSVVLQQFDRAGFAADTATPAFGQSGGIVADGRITLSAAAGEIYYTTDGTDPRLPGGAIAPSAIQYDGTIQIDADTTIRMRAIDGQTWSAIEEAHFILDAVPASADNIAISEIHFNPQPSQAGEPDVDSDEFEFVEVTNFSSTPVNLEGVRFVQAEIDGDEQGIRFQFEQQTLAAGESVVVVENVEAFRARYDEEIRIAAGVDQPLDTEGEYGGKLSNKAETLTLVDANGQAIRSVAYADAWYETTDGEGYSLEIVDPVSSAALNTATAWRPSSIIDGSPGTLAEATIRGDVNQDGDIDRLDVDAIFALVSRDENLPRADLNSDGDVSNADAKILIEDELGIRKGDADLDGDVDFADFLVLSNSFGSTDQNWLDGDMDGDGEVNFADFLLLSANFGNVG